MPPKRGCRTPSVQNCLHCQKPECDCPAGTRLDISEIRAMISAGIVGINSLNLHYQKHRRDAKNAGNRLHDTNKSGANSDS